MYVCLECNKRFLTTKAAARAVYDGCPHCGGTDIDLDDDDDDDDDRIALQHWWYQLPH